MSYQTYDASATAGNDFIGQSGTLIFNPGQTTKTISVPMINDYQFENTEYYYVAISNAQNISNSQSIVIYTASCYAYIDDDDPQVSINYYPVPSTIIESSGSQVFTVTLSSATTYSVSVQYNSFDGSAIAGSDYTTVSGTLLFCLGKRRKLFLCL
ncbi:MAG: hypothetical protein IPI46_00025 [Bacteroidetes bacterium]|nr:hypothetical protein [Bacteroidota bacterium]